MKYGTSSHLLLRQAYRYVMAGLVLVNISAAATDTISLRERISLNVGWRFTKDDPAGVGDKLNYANIKDWILPTGAVLTKDRTLAANQPAPGNPSDDIAYAQGDFDDSRFRQLCQRGGVIRWKF